jgi:hypothetical protein
MGIKNNRQVFFCNISSGTNNGTATARVAGVGGEEGQDAIYELRGNRKGKTVLTLNRKFYSHVGITYKHSTVTKIR